MDFRINTFELVRQVFGYTGIKLKFLRTKEIKYNEEIEVYEIEEHTITSALGTPIFDFIKFKAGEDSEGIEYEGLDLVDAPLIDISRQKKIVESSIQGRKGSVKEKITTQDFKVRIRGLLVNHDGEDPPYDKMEALNDLIEVDESLEVESRLFELLGIYNLVITGHDFPALEGVSNVQPFVLTCTSDEPLELLIKSGIPNGL